MLKKLVGGGKTRGHGDAPDAETGRFVGQQVTVSAILCEEIFLNFSRTFK
ncbi:MAG: hypothetical protein F6K24_36300 [Okeania sp. SIO2D1]|nr:hypothetical protein [Okeania sp. SIO2D1]